MLRRVLAIITGFSAWTILWLGFHAIMTALVPDEFNADGSTDSSAMLLAYLAASVVCSLIGGWTMALVNKCSESLMAWILGGVLLGVGLMVQLISWALFPTWYHVVFLLLLIPATFLGNSMVGAAKTPEEVTAGS